MPLNPPALLKPLLKLFKEGSTDPVKTAKIMADAYVKYTSKALFTPGVPVFTGIEHELLQATILVVLNPILMNPAGLATAWSAGITAFWLAPPILAPPGVVTACPGAIALIPVMTAICSVPGQPAEVAAAAMAASIDIATRTTIATIAGNPVSII